MGGDEATYVKRTGQIIQGQQIGPVADRVDPVLEEYARVY